MLSTKSLPVMHRNHVHPESSSRRMQPLESECVHAEHLTSPPPCGQFHPEKRHGHKYSSYHGHLVQYEHQTSLRRAGQHNLLIEASFVGCFSLQEMRQPET